MLQSLADSIEIERCKKRLGATDTWKTITFMKEGVKPYASRASVKNSLLQAASWEMRVDIGRKLQFPEVVHTALCPDIILWSACEEAHERKALKYQPLIQECRDKGWQAWLFPVEVGCRGFPANSAVSFRHGSEQQEERCS